MQSLKISLWVFLFIIWSSFIVWEIQVHKWVTSLSDKVMRVDLIFILPILILVTGYVLHKIYKKVNNK